MPDGAHGTGREAGVPTAAVDVLAAVDAAPLGAEDDAGRTDPKPRRLAVCVLGTGRQKSAMFSPQEGAFPVMVRQTAVPEHGAGCGLKQRL